MRKGRGILFPSNNPEGGQEGGGFDEEAAAGMLEEALRMTPALLIQFKVRREGGKEGRKQGGREGWRSSACFHFIFLTHPTFLPSLPIFFVSYRFPARPRPPFR